jgi:hypothetical protein
MIQTEIGDGIGNPIMFKMVRYFIQARFLKLAIKAFIVNHPNGLSYHNYGGMFLRGPGAAEDDALFAARDIEVYDNGKLEKMIPVIIIL